MYEQFSKEGSDVAARNYTQMTQMSLSSCRSIAERIVYFSELHHLILF